MKIVPARIVFFCHQIVKAMKKKALLLSFPLMLSASLFAQSQDSKKNIDQLCGCFSVNFRYAETFSPDDSYKFHDREDMNAMELVLPVETNDKKMVLQHLLVINDSMIIKHWREEWLYESPVLYEYTGNKVWKKNDLAATAVKNKWTQTVWEVSDEPRYQGVSAWVNNDGKTFWESTADAPLPRREYTVRNDYNILKRRNRITLTADGYIHEQDNDKILRKDNTDKLIAQEKGYNIYRKADDSECEGAKKWWKKNEVFWHAVRNQWDAYMATASVVTLKTNVDDKVMHEHFDALWRDWSKNKFKQSELDAKVKEVMTKFL